MAVTQDVLLPLELLDGGQSAEVVEVHGDPGCVGRMAELGLRAGAHFQVLQPGSPCLLQVGGSRLSLRGECHVEILARLL